MPADYFAALINATHDAAEKKKQEFEKNRDFDVDIYKQIALNPNTPPDKAAEAAKKIDQLMNLGKKDSPWSKLTDHLNQIRNHIQKPGGDPGLPGGKLQIGGQSGGQAAPQAQPQAGGSAPGTGPGTNTLGLPQQNPEAPQPNPVKQGFAQRNIKRVTKGLGTALSDFAGGIGSVMGRPPALPGLDVSGIPRNADIAKGKVQDTLAEVQAYEQAGFSHQEALAAAGVKLPSQSGMLRRGAEVLGKQVPQDALGPDGQPLNPDPKELYYPMVGRDGNSVWFPASASIGHVTFGNRMHAFNRYTGDIFGDDGEVIGNIAEQQVNYGTNRNRQVPAYDAAGNPTSLNLGASTTPQTAPPVGGGGTPGANTPKTPELKKRPQSLPSVDGGQASTGTGGKVYAGQFGQFSKGAMGVTEAAAALVGDQPGQPGGLLGQLGVFDKPKEVQKLSDYFTAQSQFMDQEAKTSQGSVLDYIFGLPGFLTDLKSTTLADKYNALSPEGKSFVDAFTRAIGTAPGLRGVTSASSALGALRTIEREYPNPQFVKDKKSAVNRLQNLMNEIQQAGSFNPLLRGKLKSLPKVTDSGEKTIKMKAPDGTIKSVPSSQVQHYKDLGAVEVH